jgi:hypothetical protein
MDDDIKTLLAVVALVYGSSNGAGLLKDRLDIVKTNAETLKPKIENESVSLNVIRDDARALRRSLTWNFFVLLYVAMVLLPPVFLLLTAIRGPVAALALIGLGNTSTQPGVGGSTIFYWILFGLSLVATSHYLSPYANGWRVLIEYWRSKIPHQ